MEKDKQKIVGYAYFPGEPLIVDIDGRMVEIPPERPAEVAPEVPTSEAFGG